MEEFREMRRKGQALCRKECKEILKAVGRRCWRCGETAGIRMPVPVNTVIGAGSVVTRFIPGNMLAVGVPCRVLREITEADKIPGLPDGMTGGFPKSRFHLLKNGRSVLDKQKKNRYNETIRGRFPLVSCD